MELLRTFAPHPPHQVLASPYRARIRSAHGTLSQWERDLAELFPGAASFDVDGQRYVQLDDVLHEIADVVTNPQLILGNFEDQLVVDLQHHASSQFPFAQLIENPDHRDFDNVGGGALNRRVDRRTLRHAAAHAVS